LILAPQGLDSVGTGSTWWSRPILRSYDLFIIAPASNLTLLISQDFLI